MSANSNIVSTQKIPQEATELVKLTKVSSRYVELPSFKDSEHIEATFAIIVYIL
jgi:hypothetical protein